ncbi:T9SS type A sorting domain-containing protein [Cytophagales bacterium LB-30]|uniref:T9SS type A sorting domain-containing protein n=1 Tax=Shiella aurantiaca TaxID=3058365 RepID=A0ABT8F6X8_9BACT|nr:T9SS type A sorting domain-containing protein [Shiella aurantiaca]MDN4166242.1 T9SS type A sorting domain-containing protein [Shiella aurantiaca]
MRPTRVFLVQLLVLLSLSSFAQTYYSQGTNNFSIVSNWNTAIDGSGSSPASIGAFDYVIQDGHTITLNNSYTINSLIVGNGTSGSLVLSDNNNRTLTISGGLTINNGASVIANGAFNRTATLNVGGNIAVNGTLDLFDDANSIANLVLNGGVVQTLSGTPSLIELNSLTINTGTTLTLGDQTVRVMSAFTNNGTFNPGTSTIDYAGGTQAISVSNFYNLHNTGAGTKTIASNLSIGGNVSINAGGTVTWNASANRTYQVTGNFTVESGSSFLNGTSNTSNTLTVGGDVIVTNGNFDLYFDGNSICNLEFSGNVTHNLIGSPSSAELSNFIMLDNSGIVNSGFGFTAVLGVTLGVNTQWIANSHNYFVGGNWSNSGTFTAGGSTVYLEGGTQTVSNTETFHNLIVSGTGTVTKTFSGAVNVTGDLEMAGTNSVTINTSINNLAVTGNFLVSATAGTHTISHTSGKTTVTGNLDLNGGSIFRVDGDIEVLGNTSISNSSTFRIGAATASRIITLGGDLTISAGSLIDVTNITAVHTLIVKGSIVQSGTFDLYTDANSYCDLFFDTNVVHQISGTPTLTDLANVTLNASSGSVNTSIGLPITLNLTIGASSDFITNANTIDINGSLVNNGTLTATNGTLNVAGDWTNSGTFTNTGSTVNLDGGNQTVNNAENFNQLVISATFGSTKNFSGNVSVGGNLEISGTNNVTISASSFQIAVTGNLLVTATAGTHTLTHTSGKTTVTGNFTPNGGSTFRIDGDFEVTGTSTISNASTVLIGVAATARTLTFTGDVIINSGNTFSVNTPNVTHSVLFNEDVTINGIFDMYFDADSRAVVYMNSNVAHTFSGTPGATPQFNDLVLNATSNTTTLGYAIDIQGSVTIENASTLALGTFTHTVTGNWTVNTGGVTTVGTSTVQFNRNNFIQLVQGTGTASFYNLTFNGGGANAKRVETTVSVSNLLLVANSSTFQIGGTAGQNRTLNVNNVQVDAGSTFTVGAADAIHSITLTGSITQNGTFDLYSSATRYANVTVSGLSVHSLTGTPTLTEFHDITLATSSLELLAGFNFSVLGNIIINDGAEFDVNSRVITTAGNTTINANGELSIGAGGQFLVANTRVITNQGRLRVVGASGNRAIISRNTSGNYTIVQNGASAEIFAQHYEFQYLGSGGLTISAGTINSTNNFSNGLFANGTGNHYLDLTGLNIGAGITANEIQFDAGPTYNIRRTSGTGTFTVSDASGTLAGENFDQDNANPGTLIVWTFPGLTFYSQGTGLFSTLTNWNKSAGGGGANPVAGDLTSGLAVFVVQNGHTVTVDQDINVLRITVGSGSAAGLVIGNNTTARALVIQELLGVSANGTVSIGNFTATHTLSLNGNLQNNGSINFRPTSVRVCNLTVTGTDARVSGSVAPVLNDLILTSTKNLTAQVALDIDGNVSIADGATFNDGNFTHTVAGNWSEAGTGQLSGGGTIQFNSTTSQNISTTATFNNLTVNGGGVLTLGANLTINGNFSVSNNSIVTTITNQNLRGDFSVANGSVFSASSGTFTFDGANVQNINLNNSSFFGVAFSNGGVNAKTLTGAISSPYIASLFTVNTGATVAGDATIQIGNGINLAGTSNLSGSVTITGGNINDSNDNTLSLGTAELTIAGNVSLLSGKSLSINNNLSITSGTFVLQSGSSITDTGHAFSISNGAAIQLEGTDNFPTGFASYSFGATSTTRFRNTAAQTVRGGHTYGNVSLDGTAAHVKTLESSIEIEGTLTLNSNVTFNLNTHTITVGGNLTGGSGTINGNGNLILDADDLNQTISAGTYSFNNFTITQGLPTATRTKAIQANITLTGSFNASNPGGANSVLLVIDPDAFHITGGAGSSFILGPYVRYNTSAGTGAGSFRTAMATFTSVSLDPESRIRYDLNGNQDLADGFAYGILQFENNGNKSAFAGLDINGRIERTGGNPVFVDGGFTHTVAGDFALTTAYYPLPTGTIVLDGVNQNVSASNFNNLTVSNSGTASLIGNINLLGNFTVSDGAIFDASTYNINLDGNWVNGGSGQYIQTTGTVTFDGTSANQTISSNGNSYFGALNINKTNASFRTVTALTDLDINRSVTLAQDNATFDFSNVTLSLGDNWTANTGTTIISTGSTMAFDGPDLQSIRQEGAGSFNNISFSNAGIKRFRDDTDNLIDIDGDVTITASTVDASWDGTYFANLTVGGNWINDGSFNHTNRTLTFDGANQSISSSNFGNVVFAGTGTKTLDGNISLANSLTINASSTLDVSASNYGITLGGNWNNNGTFVPNTGTVTFNGSTSTINPGGTGAGKVFYNVDINNSTGVIVLGGDIDIDNNLIISSGTFRTNTFDVYLAGSLSNTGGAFDQNNAASQITLNASSGSPTINSGGSTLRDIFFEAPGIVYSLANNLTIANSHSITLNGGTFNLSGYTLSFTGNATANRLIINTGTTLDIDAGAQVLLANNNNLLNNGGTLRIVGVDGNPAILGTSSTTGYTVTQTSGIIEAEYYLIQSTISTGVTISGGTIDATHNFSNGTFSGGAGSQYLTLTGLNFTDFSVDNVSFNVGPSFNVARTSGTGSITFTDANGGLAGESYDNDDANPGTLILWTFPDGFFWVGADGTDNTDWHRPANWFSNTVPSNPANDIVYLNHDQLAGAYTVSIKTANATPRRVILDAQGGAAITLEVTGGFDLNLNENLIIGVGTTVTVTDANSLINVGTSWSNLGTFNPGSGTVVFTGTSGINTINAGTTAGRAFNNLTINGGATYNLASNIDVNGKLLISNGTLDATSDNYDIYLSGNWEVSGTGSFTPRAADVFLDQSIAGIQTISGGTFYNLETLAAAALSTKLLASNISISRRLTLGTNTAIDAGSNSIQVAENWVNNASTTAFIQTGAGSVTFNGVNQTIDNGSFVTTFNTLVFGGTGTKTFNQPSVVNGDFLVSSGVGTVNFGVHQISGAGGSNTFTVAGNATVQLRGINNFPSGFETISIAPNSTFEYIADINQNIFATTYGNLRLRRATSATTTKTALGHLEVTGTLTLNDATTTLDMATNDANLTLTGSINAATGSNINWGTGNSTLIHVGTNDICDPGSSSWCMDADITTYNNMILGGQRAKVLNSNLSITGSITVQSGVTLNMQGFTITGDGTGIFTLSGGSNLNTAVASPSIAYPTGFTYSIDPTSTTDLNSAAGVNQILFSGVTYGNLYFSNAKTVTSDGVANLNVDGLWDTESATYIDNGRNISVAGPTISIANYTPSSSSILLTLDGVAQTIRATTPAVNVTALTIPTIVFAGSGTKTLGDGNDIITIQGNLTVNSGVTVNTARDITMNGAAFANNNGTFNHTANLFTFDKATAQSINPGANNSFNNVAFSGAGVKTFSANGVDVNGSFTINTGSSVSMGALTHTIAGTVTNNSTWTTAAANIEFDGGNQTITTPSFVANNVTISGTGTKTMTSTWSVNDLTITSSTLNTGAGPYNITLTGSWTNSGGGFTANGNTVNFNGVGGTETITTGGSSFNFVNFAPSVATSYTLQSATTTVTRDMTIGANATVDLNSNRLNLGTNVAGGKTYSVAGTLEVDENATLSFDNRTSQCVLNVTGTLRLVGTSGNVATITRHQTGVAGAETQINITTGTIEARFYLIEYLSDAGMDVQSTATLHATNNFSDGTWSNIRTNAGIKRYLTLNADATGVNTIANVVFNFSGTPTQGTHFNVRRAASAIGTITFVPDITGNLGDFNFEDDGEGIVAAITGKLVWPGVTSVTWIGNVSTDWHNANNWSPATIPTTTITANIPAGSPNNPIISTSDAECKSLLISNGQLSVQNGHDLEVNGDVTIGTGTSVAVLAISNSGTLITVNGSWTKGTNGVFNNGSGTVEFITGTGSSVITPGTAAFYNLVVNNTSTEFILVGSTINVSGSLTINNGTLTPSTNNYTINLDGNLTNNGVFTTSTVGKVILNGGLQNITNGTFYNLDVAGTSDKNFYGNATIQGALTVYSSLVADGGSILDMNGNVLIQAGASFEDGGNTHLFGGTAWTGTGTYTGTGAIEFDRAGTQTLNASNLNSLVVNNQGGVFTLAGDVTLTGDVTLKAGINYANFQEYQITSSNGQGTFTLENAEEIWIFGANNFPSGFAFYDLQTDSRVSYRGTSDQTIYPTNYARLDMRNSNVKTLGGDILVSQDLAFSTATLDVSPSNYSINISGNWNNNGGGTFIPRGGEVIFEEAANQSIFVAVTSTNPFNRITLNKTSGQVSTNSALTLAGTLRVNDGTFTANGRTITVGGDLIVIDGTIANSGWYIFNKPTGTVNLQTNASIFNNITFDGASTEFVIVDELNAYGNFYLDNGILNGNGKALQLGNGADAVSISGILQLGDGGSLRLGDNTTLTVNASGTIEIIGSSVNPAIVSRNATNFGRYAFQVNGMIKARNYLFEYFDQNGIVISSTATIDATDNFSDGTFTNGAGNGYMLRIENTQNLTGANRIENVNFPVAPGGSSANVVKLAAGSGTLEFYNATGVFAGESFDNDPNNLIDWTGPVTLTWDGSLNTNWFVADNWTASSGPNIVPTGAENVIIASSVNQPLISVDGALVANLTINSGATLTISTSDANQDLTVNGDITISGTLISSSSDDIIEVIGSWQKNTSGTVSLNGLVKLTGTGGTKSINNGSNAFRDLEIDASTSYQLSANTTILGNLTITAGSMDVSNANRTLTIGGDFINSGTFESKNGKVIFNSSSGTKTISVGTSSNFYDVDINGDATFNLGTTTSIRRNLNIIQGTLSLNGQELSVGSTGSPFISVSGTLDVDANAILRLGNAVPLTVNSGGTLRLVGDDDDNQARITRISTGNYSLTVNSGGTIAAQYYLVEYTNVNGVYIKSGAAIDATNNLSNGTYASGFTGGRFIQLENDLNGGTGITINNVTFGTGPAYNITRTTGLGTLLVFDAEGALGNYLFEQDDEATPSAVSGLVEWDYTFPLLSWTGNVSTDFTDPDNWSPVLMPSSTTNLIIPDVSSASNNFPRIDATSGDVESRNLTVLTGGVITLADNANLTMAGEFNNAGTVTVSPGSSSLITVASQWSNTGTFTAGASTVEFTAATGFVTITTGGNNFNNLSLNGTATFRPSTSMTVSNHFTLSAGTFDVTSNNYQLNVGGDFTNNATFVPRQGTVVFNKVGGIQTITAGTTSGKEFYNLTKSTGSTSTLVLGTDLDINNNLSVQAGSMNGGNNTIYIAGNWSFTSTANSTSTNVEFDGSVSKTFTNFQLPQFVNVRINKTGGANLILNNPLQVNGTLDLTSGDIVLGSRNVNFADAAFSINASQSSYIQADGSGTVRKYFTSAPAATFLFPVGDASNYTPFTFTLNSGTLAGGANVTVNVKNAAHPTIATITPATIIYLNRYWSVNQTGITNPNYDLSAQYLDSDVQPDISAEANLVVAKYSTNTSPNWTKGGGVLDASNTIFWAGVTSFSDITGVGEEEALPIQLEYFRASLDGEVVELSWRTQTETNNDYFTIERSQNGLEYQELGYLEGSGTTRSAVDYAFTDASPMAGISYYRLKQTDYNGAFEYSPVVKITNYSDMAISLAMYPNPAQSETVYLKMGGLAKGQLVDILVYDTFGKKVWEQQGTVEEVSGEFSADINVRPFKSGVYIVRILTERGQMVQKLTVK